MSTCRPSGPASNALATLGGHPHRVQWFELHELVIELDVTVTGQHHVDLLRGAMPMRERLAPPWSDAQVARPSSAWPRLDPRKSGLLGFWETAWSAISVHIAGFAPPAPGASSRLIHVVLTA
jgi:hypothetical protein